MKHLLNTLYILTPESYLYLQNNAVIVKVGGVEKVRVPINGIESIYCFCDCAVSSPLIEFCGKLGVSLVFFSPHGKFYGRIQGPISGNILLRERQFAALEDPIQRARYAQGFLLGKIANSKLFLQRQRRERPGKEGTFDAAINAMSAAAEGLSIRPGIETMRGIEGAAAAAYFAAMPAMLTNPTFTFDGRNRRPPEDPVNALLSFAYTILKNDVQSALEGVGLDPAAGFLHSLRPGRPALALDIMEELRAPLCDRLVISLINKGQISEKSFEQMHTPVLLNENGRKTFLKAWSDRKKEVITHPFLNEKVPIGLIPYIQAKLFAKVLRDELDTYPPFIWR